MRSDKIKGVNYDYINERQTKHIVLEQVNLAPFLRNSDVEINTFLKGCKTCFDELDNNIRETCKDVEIKTKKFKVFEYVYEDEYDDEIVVDKIKPIIEYYESEHDYIIRKNSEHNIKIAKQKNCDNMKKYKNVLNKFTQEEIEEILKIKKEFKK